MNASSVLELTAFHSGTGLLKDCLRGFWQRSRRFGARSTARSRLVCFL